MQYLKCKGIDGGRVRKNGTLEVTPLFVSKSRKFGKVRSETALSRKRPILIVGANNSGKSHMIQKLYEQALNIWGGQPKIAGRVMLSGLASITAWHDQAEIIAWHDRTQTKLKPLPKPVWKKLNAHQKDEALVEYCTRVRTVLMLDDAHKLTGRKADIAKKCLQVAKITVVAASEENRLPPSLRSELLKRNPQIISLNSDVAYDVTPHLMWGLIAGALFLGAYEVAFILAALKWLGRGRRAARQE